MSEPRLEGMSPEEKRALLARLLEQKQNAATQVSTSPPPRAALLPLSSAQRRLWLLAHWDAAAKAYIVPAVLRFAQRPEVTLLQKALDKIVARHEILRTKYVDGAAGPEQIVEGAAEFQSPLLKELPYSDAEFARALSDPLEPGRGQVLRLTLLFEEGGRAALAIAIHHIAIDGWSLRQFLRELASTYTALARGEEAAFPESWQYADYALWEQAQRETPAWRESMDYWKRHLDGMPSTTLPMQQRRVLCADYNGAVVLAKIDSVVCAQVKALAMRQGATPFATLLAAWQETLRRFAAGQEVPMGTPVANRQAPFEEVLGCFVDVKVLRTKFPSESTFADAVGQASREVREALAHGTVAFNEIVEHLHPHREAARHPLFQVAFAYHVADSSPLRFGDVEARIEVAPEGDSRYELELHVSDEGETLEARLLYQTAIHEGELVRSLLMSWMYLLERVCEAPDAPLTSIASTALTLEELGSSLAG